MGPGAADEWREGMRAAVLPVFSCGDLRLVPGRRRRPLRRGRRSWVSAAAPAGSPSWSGRAPTSRSRCPTTCPPRTGPLVEPFAVGLHTARIAGIAPGDDVLVIGAGPVGLTTAWWARDLGARTVTVSDPVERAPRRRSRASGRRRRSTRPPPSLGGPYDVVIECVGKPGLLDASAGRGPHEGPHRRGRACAPSPTRSCRWSPCSRSSPSGSRCTTGPTSSAPSSTPSPTGRLDPAPLVTRTVGLADLDEVFASLATSPDRPEGPRRPTRARPDRPSPGGPVTPADGHPDPPGGPARASSCSTRPTARRTSTTPA